MAARRIVPDSAGTAAALAGMALRSIALSLPDAIALIEKAQDFPTQTQLRWICSLRQIAKGLDRLLKLIPARWTGLRPPVSRLHHLPLGTTAKTLANTQGGATVAQRRNRPAGTHALAISHPQAAPGPVPHRA